MNKTTRHGRNVFGRKVAALLAVGTFAVAAYGNTEWHSNTAKNTGSQAGGNAALTDMSYPDLAPIGRSRAM